MGQKIYAEVKRGTSSKLYTLLKAKKSNALQKKVGINSGKQIVQHDSVSVFNPLFKKIDRKDFKYIKYPEEEKTENNIQETAWNKGHCYQKSKYLVNDYMVAIIFM